MRKRLADQLNKEAFDLVILVTPPNVIYASAFEVPYFGGFMADMAKGLPMVTAVIDVNQSHLDLLVSDFYRSKVERSGQDKSRYFVSFDYRQANSPEENYSKALKSFLQKQKQGCKVGVELTGAPYILLKIITETLQGAEIKDVTPALEKARSIKEPDEIQMLEKAAKAADAAQNRLAELSKIQGNYTELDVWFEVQKKVSEYTGEMNPFYGELVTGERTGLSDYPLGPTGRLIKKGDIAIMDVGPRVGGYWSDCSNAVVFWDEPNDEQKRYFRAVRAAYEAGRRAVFPGVTFKEVNDAIERTYREHGFSLGSYLGHQIGVNVNENPRFTLYDHTVLEENMVVCIEPQLYTGTSGKTGVRLEKMLHVTAAGARELNKFKWGIEEI